MTLLERIKECKTNKDFINIKFGYTPSKEEQLAAVKENGYNIRFINSPDKDV